MGFRLDREFSFPSSYHHSSHIIILYIDMKLYHILLLLDDSDYQAYSMCYHLVRKDRPHIHPSSDLVHYQAQSQDC